MENEKKSGWKFNVKNMNRTRKKVNGVAKVLGYGMKSYSSKEFTTIIREALQQKENQWFETGWFKYTKRKKTIIIEPAFHFRILFKRED